MAQPPVPSASIQAKQDEIKRLRELFFSFAIDEQAFINGYIEAYFTPYPYDSLRKAYDQLNPHDPEDKLVQDVQTNIEHLKSLTQKEREQELRRYVSTEEKIALSIALLIVSEVVERKSNDFKKDLDHFNELITHIDTSFRKSVGNVPEEEKSEYRFLFKRLQSVIHDQNRNLHETWIAYPLFVRQTEELMMALLRLLNRAIGLISKEAADALIKELKARKEAQQHIRQRPQERGEFVRPAAIPKSTDTAKKTEEEHFKENLETVRKSGVNLTKRLNEIKSQLKDKNYLFTGVPAGITLQDFLMRYYGFTPTELSDHNFDKIVDQLRLTEEFERRFPPPISPVKQTVGKHFKSIEEILRDNPTLLASIQNYANAAIFLRLDDVENEFLGFPSKEFISRFVLEELSNTRAGFTDIRLALQNNPHFLKEFQDYFYSQHIAPLRAYYVQKTGKISLLSDLTPEQTKEFIRTNAYLTNQLGMRAGDHGSGARALQLFYAHPKKELRRQIQEYTQKETRTQEEEWELEELQLALATQEEIEHQSAVPKTLKERLQFWKTPQPQISFEEVAPGAFFETYPIDTPDVYIQDVLTNGVHDEVHAPDDNYEEVTTSGKTIKRRKRPTVARLQSIKKRFDTWKKTSNVARLVLNPHIAAGTIVGGGVGLTVMGLLAKAPVLIGSGVGTLVGGGVGFFLGGIPGMILGAGLGGGVGGLLGGAVQLSSSGTTILPAGAGNVVPQLATQAVSGAAPTVSALTQTGVGAATHAANIGIGTTNALLNTLPSLPGAFTSAGPATALFTFPVFTAGVITTLGLAAALGAFLVPDEGLELESKYISIQKTAAPSRFENAALNPGATVNYTITLSPKQDPNQPFTVTITSIQDSMSVRSRTQPAPQPPPGPDLTSLQGELTQEKQHTYSIIFSGSSYEDSRITNTVMITYDVRDAQGNYLAQGETFSASASVVFGNPPDDVGCFVFGSSGQTLRASGTTATTVDWTESEKNLIAEAFYITAEYTTYRDLLCQKGPVTLHRLRGSSFGGWAVSPNDIAIYDIGLLSVPNARYTLVHESGHTIALRNGTVFQEFIRDVFGKESYIRSYRYAAAGTAAEDFPESLAVFMTYHDRKYIGNTTCINMPTEYRIHYDWVKATIFNGLDSPNDPNFTPCSF